MKNTTIHLRITEELKAQVQAKADENMHNMSEIIRRCLEAYVEDRLDLKKL